jgi:two-component system, NtrC family, response regulator AtoC
MSTQAVDTAVTIPAAPRSLKELVEEYERELILKALRDCGGHQRRAARALGILPTTLSEKMRRLSLRRRATDGA